MEWDDEPAHWALAVLWLFMYNPLARKRFFDCEWGQRLLALVARNDRRPSLEVAIACGMVIESFYYEDGADMQVTYPSTPIYNLN